MKRNDDIEIEVRQKDEGEPMIDQELSAHQFSKRSISIQADEEERLEAEFQMSAISRSPKSRVFSPKSWGKSRHTVVSLPTSKR